ncbi:hypothetical protein CS542_04790 [Pedobacter sp. IW39]|nr:hypothetical protein CS542_04790 [Pedobacter sp. IW39]
MSESYPHPNWGVGKVRKKEEETLVNRRNEPGVKRSLDSFLTLFILHERQKTASDLCNMINFRTAF